MVELVLAATLAAEPAEAKLCAAGKAKKVGAGNTATRERERVHQAQQAGFLIIKNVELINRGYDLRDKVIRVDDFPPDFSQAAHR